MDNNQLFELMYARIEHLARPEFKDYLRNDGFLTAPASTKYHGAYEGGLFEHSMAVMDTLVDLTQKNGLVWQRPESPIIVGAFHDLCKCDQYKKVGGTVLMLHGEQVSEPNYEYNTDTVLKGHGEKSVMILSRFMTLTEEEVLCIRYHMGPYIKEDQEGYDLAIRKYSCVLWVHHADMIASKVVGI